MSPDQESFEESQRRFTGTSQGTQHQYASRFRQIRWRRVLLPAAFLAIPFTLIVRDFFGEPEVPPLALAGIYILMFLVAATLFAFRENTRKKNRHRET